MESKPLQLKKLTEAFPIRYSAGVYPDEIIDVIPYIFVEDVRRNSAITEISITLVCNQIIKKGTKTFIKDRIKEDVFGDKKIKINLIERYRFDNKNIDDIKSLWEDYRNELLDETKKEHLVIYLMLFVDCESFEIKECDSCDISKGIEVFVKVKNRDTYKEHISDLEIYLKDVFEKRFNLSRAVINIDLIKDN
jgi:hypothetical protein